MWDWRLKGEEWIALDSHFWYTPKSRMFFQKTHLSLYTWKAFVQLYHSWDRQKLRIKFNFGVYDKEKLPVAGALRNFVKFTGKQLCQSLFLDKVAGLRPEAYNFIKKETLAQVLSCEFCEISKNTFSYRTPPVAASEID